MRSEKFYCQVPGCHRRAERAVAIDLPAAWEPTTDYTTLTVHAGFCLSHGKEVERRVEGILEARSDLVNVLTVVEAAILSQHSRQFGGVAS